MSRLESPCLVAVAPTLVVARLLPASCCVPVLLESLRFAGWLLMRVGRCSRCAVRLVQVACHSSVVTKQSNSSIDTVALSVCTSTSYDTVASHKCDTSCGPCEAGRGGGTSTARVVCT